MSIFPRRCTNFSLSSGKYHVGKCDKTKEDGITSKAEAVTTLAGQAAVDLSKFRVMPILVPASVYTDISDAFKTLSLSLNSGRAPYVLQPGLPVNLLIHSTVLGSGVAAKTAGTLHGHALKSFGNEGQNFIVLTSIKVFSYLVMIPFPYFVPGPEESPALLDDLDNKGFYPWNSAFVTLEN